MTALYVVIRNESNLSCKIVGMTVAGAQRVEMHQSAVDARGMMHMAAVPEIVVDAGHELRLEPGGMHAMVFGGPGKSDQWRAGRAVHVAVRCADGRKAETDAQVRGLTN
jgi:hypothetical protein